MNRTRIIKVSKSHKFTKFDSGLVRYEPGACYGVYASKALIVGWFHFSLTSQLNYDY
jgi:hypothetical protein